MAYNSLSKGTAFKASSWRWNLEDFVTILTFLGDVFPKLQCSLLCRLVYELEEFVGIGQEVVSGFIFFVDVTSKAVDM